MLRQSGPEVYDQWVANEVKFTDPEIADAFDAVGEILLNPEYVNASFGDVASINSTAFAAVAAPVADRQACALTHQASFLVGELPRHRERRGRGADGRSRRRRLRVRAARASKRARQRSRSAASSSPRSRTTRRPWRCSSTCRPRSGPTSASSLGGNISANLNADPSLASSEFLTEAMELLQDPNTTVRFDASDLMPSTVGAGSFWKGMVDWIDGKDTATVLSDIQAGYEN